MSKVLLFGFLTIMVVSFSGCIKMDASLPDITEKPDGVYRGEYKSGFPVKVVLDVTVQNHYMTEIDIVEHECSAIGKQAEKIIGRIIKKQSLNVDAMSGATVSSESILKAVENALQ
jgi:uncharacterized protein with FMN-binding domain